MIHDDSLLNDYVSTYDITGYKSDSQPKWVLQGKKMPAQKIRGKYLQILGGDLQPLEKNASTSKLVCAYCALYPYTPKGLSLYKYIFLVYNAAC